MAGYLRVLLAIGVFWSVAHFQYAAILKDDRPLTHIHPKLSTDVTTGGTHGLRRENESKESRFKRQAGLNGKPTNIQEELKSLREAEKILQSNVTALKEQMDERVKADDEQSRVSNSLRNDFKELEEKAIGRLRDEVTSNITSLEGDLERHVIEYENLTSQVVSLGEKLEDEESNGKKLESNVSLLQGEVTSQRKTVDGLKSSMGTLKSRLKDQEHTDDILIANVTGVHKKLESNVSLLHGELTSQRKTVDGLTSSIGTLEGRLKDQEGTNDILIANVTGVRKKLESNVSLLQGELTSQRKTVDGLKSSTGTLEGRLKDQEHTDGILIANVTSMRKKLESNVYLLQGELTSQRKTVDGLTSSMDELKSRLEDQEHTGDILIANVTSVRKKLESNVSLLQGELTSQRKTVDGLTSSMGTLEGRRKDQERTNGILIANVTSVRKILESNVSLLQGELTSQRKTVDGLKSSMGTLEDRLKDQERILITNVTSVQKRMNVHENLQSQVQEELRKAESKWASDFALLEARLFCHPYKSNFQSSCYHVVNEKLRWYDAKVNCRRLGGKLTSIESSEENDYVKRMVKEAGEDNFWLGGTDGDVEGTWVWASSNRGLTFSDWHKKEPNNMEQKKHCLELTKELGYKWNDNDCRRTFKSVCEKSVLSSRLFEQPEVSCPKYGFQSSCYKVVVEKQTWSDAKEKCMSFGGKLAEIESSEENNYVINEVLKNFPKENYWIGGTDEVSEGNWKWNSDGPVPKPNAWGTSGHPWWPREPNNAYEGKPENCLSIRNKDGTFKWNDLLCTVNISAICEM